MTEEYSKIIKTEWDAKLASIFRNSTQAESELHCSQSWDVIVSQLMIPTLSLLIDTGALYYARKSFKKDEIKIFEDKLESLSNSIQEILENYMIDPNIINAVMAEIGKKILKL